MTKAEKRLKTITGGPAFPNRKTTSNQPGVTVLDWFAGQAMIGMLGGRNGFLVDIGTDNVAGWAYDTAENMIAEKRRREQETE